MQFEELRVVKVLAFLETISLQLMDRGLSKWVGSEFIEAVLFEDLEILNFVDYNIYAMKQTFVLISNKMGKLSS